MKSIILSIVFALAALAALAQDGSTEVNDSIAAEWERQYGLNEVVVVARRPVVKQQEGRLVYTVKNDPYAQGLDAMTLLDRIPRVSVTDGNVSVAGKGNVRYIIDGTLMELDANAMKMRLQAMQADGIEKIELLTTPPSRYAAESNAAYISITTKNETLGTRGNVYGALTQSKRLSGNLSGSVNHTTRRVEISLDANFVNVNGINDTYATYDFGDCLRQSDTHKIFHNTVAGTNALFKYKFSPKMSIGAIANYSYNRADSDGANRTDYGSHTSNSTSSSLLSPSNALTLTGFYDWTFSDNGNLLQLTYNYFTKHDASRSDISTVYDFDIPEPRLMSEHGTSDYRFHSGKVDFKLPYSWATIEAGLSYTAIDNTARLDISSAAQNKFDYIEDIAAAYFTAYKSFSNGLSAKVGIRYEYTWSKGVSLSMAESHTDRYGCLFPTLNISWKGVGASYSMGMGRPNFNDLDPFRYYTTVDEYSGGNPYLEPTTYHNAEINYYGLKGLYAVLYTSFVKNAIGWVTRFDADNVKSITPYNCLTTNKTGLYANYRCDISDWWQMTLGGEVYHSYSHGNIEDIAQEKRCDWSGKVDANGNWILNRPKTLVFNVNFTHFFPHRQNMVKYKSHSLISFALRYSLLSDRLNLRLQANDIFGWNKTRSVQNYATFTYRQTFDHHPASVIFSIAYSFGGSKVNSVWRDSKETQSSRTIRSN